MTDLQKNFLREKALHYFLKYVQINSQSDPNSDSSPSSACQLELGKIIVNDLQEMGLTDAVLDDFGYVYTTLPASQGFIGQPISFIAHMDTSPSEPGKDVKSVFHKAYSGGDILFEDDAELLLNPKESPELAKFIGEDIITAAGKTLLGADDKAGIASIIAALALLITDPSLPHPELKICFTPDEEVGRGVDNINLDKLAQIAYTIDGGELGELEAECFDAWSAVITFTGRNVHPGSSKNIMINSASTAARFVADIPEWQSPEHTEKREGFYHLTSISGEENSTVLRFILRDFDAGNNEQRMEFLQSLAEAYRKKYPGLIISLDFHHSYLNMHHILKDHQAVIDTAAETMQEVGIDVLHNAIRGGTDGARLCYMGIPTPNIFGGGVMFHSRREWIPVIALQKAAEVVVKIAEKYSK